MMKLIKHIFIAFFAVLVVYSQSLMAEEKIGIPNIVPFAKTAVVSEGVRTKCDLGGKLSSYLLKALKGSANTSENPDYGRYLDMEITHVRAVAGGRFSGPKWVEVTGALNDNGQLGPTFRAKRWTIDGFRACGAAKR